MSPIRAGAVDRRLQGRQSMIWSVKASSPEGSTGGLASLWPSIRVFGGIGLEDPDGPISIGGPRQRRLLGLLALRAETVLDIDWLAEYLWDDDDRPDLTEPLIRTYVSRLRAAFPAGAREWIVTVPEGYRLDAPVDAVEHLRFGRLRAAATGARERGDPQTALQLLDEALGLWRGEPFRELGDLELAESEIERLRLDRLDMMEERWEAALALGRHTQITGELAAFASEHGERDRAVRQYALALHRSGQTTEALRVVREHRRVLVEEFGLDPSAEITQLEKALLDDDPSLLIEKDGRPLRGYRLIEEVGMGSFAIVWRGSQPSVGRDVAIKQIRAELASQPDFIRRFEAEAHLVARLEHPHIVPLIDYWREPDSAYLVMRWLSGGTLERRLDDGPLDLDTAIALARQIGGALAAAHARGVIHRDVKSANILFDEDGNAFLTDFGIALAGVESGGPEAALSPGSPAYASPEQLRRERLSPASDVFSLGVVLFESLSGSLPFPADTPLDVLVDKQLSEPYPTLAEVRPDIPEAVSAAIARATSKDPADRFGSVDAFVAALTSEDISPAATATAEATTAASREDLPNPYLGLLAFDDASADRFYGRERLVGELLARLDGNGTASRCLVIVGPSGSGKSSVARAGLLPKLRDGAIAGSGDWFQTSMAPGDDPYESLEAALLRVAVNPPSTLLDQLRDGRRGILRGVRRCLPSERDRLLLLVDQTEELFLGRSADDADEFLDALAVAVTDPTSPLRAVMTLRADYYHLPLEHPTFAPILDAGGVNVTPLAGDELEQAIVEPARALGVGFEPGLVARIAAETMGEPSPLPLLQYALAELFERRSSATMTSAAYDEVGGLAGALAQRAEAIHEQGDPAERMAVRHVFGALADPAAQNADLRRRVRIADLGDDDATAWVLDHFGGARLLVFDHDAASRDPTVEVAHEALLREWPRLEAWLEADREILRATAVLADAATRWDEGGRRDEDLLRGLRLAQGDRARRGATQRRLRALDLEYLAASHSAADAAAEAERGHQRRVRLLGTGVAAALVTAVALGGLALLGQTRADDEMRAAAAAQDRADLALLQRRATESSPRVGLLLALEAERRDPGPESDDVLLAALRRTGGGRLVASYPALASGRCATPDILVSRDGLTQSAIVGDALVTRDLTTGQTQEHGSAPAQGCVRWFGDAATGRRYAFNENGSSDDPSLWLGPLDGPWEVRVSRAGSSRVPGPYAFGPTRLLLQGPNSVFLVDSVTGQLVAPPFYGLADDPRAQLSPDELRFAVVAPDPDGPGEVVIIRDAHDGSELVRMSLPSGITAMAFDDEASQLLVAASDGRLRTLDLDSGALIADVAVDGKQFEGPGSIGVAADDLVTLISSGPDGQVQVIDRLTGQSRSPTRALAQTSGGRTRSDGTVVTWGADRELDVIDPGSDPLVERTADLTVGDARLGDNELLVIVNGRKATMLPFNPETARSMVVDLADGQPRLVSLLTPDGRRFPETRAYGAGDGLVAVTQDQRVGLWIDGVEVDEIVVESDRRGPLFGTRSNDPYLVVGLGGGDGTIDGTIEDDHLLEIRDGRIEPRFTVTGPPAEWMWPMSDGSLWIVRHDGLAELWDASGTLLEERSFTIPDAARVSIFAADERGRVAYVRADAPGGLSRIEIRDLARGETIERTAPGLVNYMGFARDGALLALQMVDGSVRLMDVESGVTSGVLWDGEGTQLRTPWYDKSTDFDLGRRARAARAAAGRPECVA